MSRKPTLSQELEYAVLYAITRGLVASDVVDEEELSKAGKVIRRAILALLTDGLVPPFELRSVGLCATEVLGAQKETMREYLTGMQHAIVGIEVADILAKVHAKQVLCELVTEASNMMRDGSMDVGVLSSLITKDSKAASDLRSVSDRIDGGFPDPPQGIPFNSLPLLSQATGGLYGMWAVSGEPGVGKSTLGWHMALDIGFNSYPVIYYDFENGWAVLMDHTRQICGGNLETARRLTTRIYHRDSIRTLDSDLSRVAPPAVIVIDSIQKLPGGIERRASLDRWVHRLENLKKRGYHILVISEIPRSQYNQDAYIGAFKETGEIEYSADAAMQLLPGQDNGCEVHIVKNRHRPTKGCVSVLGRVSGWKFAELGGPISYG